MTEILHKGCEKLIDAQSDALASLRQRFASRQPGELVSSVARTPIAVDDDPGPDVRQEDTGPTSIRHSPVDTRDAAPLELVVPASMPQKPIAPPTGQAAPPVSGAIRIAPPASGSMPTAETSAAAPRSGTVPRAAPVASSSKVPIAQEVSEPGLVGSKVDPHEALVEEPAANARGPDIAPAPNETERAKETPNAGGASSRKGATQPLAPPMAAPRVESAEPRATFTETPSTKGSTIPMLPARPAAPVSGDPSGDLSRDLPARTSQTVPIAAPASSTGPVSMGPITPRTAPGMAPTGNLETRRSSETSTVPWGVIAAVLGIVVVVFGLLVAVLFAMGGS